MANPNIHPNFAKLSKSSSSITATLNPAGNQNQTNTSTIQYDRETYLELVAGQSNKVEKTASPDMPVSFMNITSYNMHVLVQGVQNILLITRYRHKKKGY